MRASCATYTRGDTCDHEQVSVVVCTLGNRETLGACLDSLLAQECHRVEILVVCNGELTEGLQQQLAKYPVRILHEPRRGVNVARNRAVREAAGEILTFLDDDVIVHPQWLHEMAAGFRDPLVACVTGRMTLEGPVFETPEEMQDSLHNPRFLSEWTLDHSDESWPRKVLEPGLGYGCNMAFSRRFLDLRLFPEDMGAGSVVPGGDEGYMFFQVLKNGYRLCHRPSAMVTHLQEGDRRAQKSRRIQLCGAMTSYRLRLLMEEPEMWLSLLGNGFSALGRRIRRLIPGNGRKENGQGLLSQADEFRAYLRGLWIHYQWMRQSRTVSPARKNGRASTT